MERRGRWLEMDWKLFSLPSDLDLTCMDIGGDAAVVSATGDGEVVGSQPR